MNNLDTASLEHDLQKNAILSLNSAENIQSLAELTGIRLDSMIQSLQEDSLEVKSSDGVYLDVNQMEVSYHSPNSLGLSLILINRGHGKEESKFKDFEDVSKIDLRVNIQNPEKFLFLVRIPESEKEAQLWAAGGVEDVEVKMGEYWLEDERYKKQDYEFTPKDFEEYCKLNKLSGLGVLLSALRADKNLLGFVAKRALERFVDIQN